VTYTVAAVPDVEAEIPRVLHVLEGVGLVARAVSPAPSTEHAQAALRHGAIDLLLAPGSTGDHLEPGVWTAATLSRGEPGDVLVPRESSDQTLQSLAAGSRIAVAGRRRSSFLRVHRRDLEPVLITPGQSAVDALEDPLVDAAVLGLMEARRLGLSGRTTEALDLRSWVPAPAQGITLLLCRPTDREARRALRSVDDGVAQAALQAERAASRSLQLRPDSTAGVVALPQGRWMRIFGMVASPDGRRMVRGDVTSSAEGPAAAGRALADLLLARGAARLLEDEAA
jgi:hydroxymethylbilane synthase